MSAMSWILALSVLVIGIAWLVIPVLRRADEVSTDVKRDALLVAYERIVATIRDLDEDFATGKLQQADYDTQREALMQRGMVLLEALGEKPGKQKASRGRVQKANIDTALDEAIEAAVARAMAK